MQSGLRWVATAAIAIVGAATVAHADVFDGANVRATFDGWLTPKALPRTDPVPVQLHLKGSLKTSNGEQPPALRRVVIALNRHGKVSTKGLPVCVKSSISAATTRQALNVCRDALIGQGRFNAHVVLPAHSPFPARGRILAFHSKRDGKHVILVHIFGTDPLPTSQVLTLTFTRPENPGAFGTFLSLRLPKLRDDWGHVTGFRMTLRRRYTYRDKIRGVFSASCAAPRGFHVGIFVAAKGTYYLADGRVLSRTITGVCRVKR
jgi:hypothetical protein